ncbi:MAG TPA: DUF6624 domain-containing protein [Alphaproteobacteria bacterium]|nr:DUF6624 domain-containing protein [Alphaproteobacteria bacterium]
MTGGPTEEAPADPRAELLRMAAADRVLRAKLAATGALFEGYDEEMAALHRWHAHSLGELIDAHGWPGRGLVGEDGAEAAWIVLQHAIGDPALMRRCLPLLEAAAEAGEAPAWQVAYLADRIRVLEGRPQRFGTQFDWDAEGRLSPLPVEAPETLDIRRAALGLAPMAEAVEARRRAAAAEGEGPPPDPAARRAAFEAWAVRTGWRR